MPLAPLRNDSTRPTERGVWRRLLGCVNENKRSALLPLLLLRRENFQTTRPQIPFRRPNEGIAQGGARHGCRARSDGPWMALRDDPRSNAGEREVRTRSDRTRMQGRAFFCLLFFARAKKSEAPCKAQTVAPAKESAASSPEGLTQCVAHSRSRPPPQEQDRRETVGAALEAMQAASQRSRPRPLLQNRHAIFTKSTTPSTPADSPPATAAPPHWPARYWDRSHNAAAHKPPAPRASRSAVAHRPSRSPPQ